jgi:hypothetical protein
MNKITFRLLMLFAFITVNTFAQVGTTCTNPIQINSIPYQTQDDTANYLDLIDGVPGTNCGASSSNGLYLNGNEVFYSFIAASSTSITISSQTNTNWSGLFVYNSCANVGISCVGGDASGNGNTTPDTVTFTPTIGQNYIVVISTWGDNTATQSTLYNLSIIENSCTNMTANFSLVSNCASITDTFFVNANVTNMGSATSIIGTTTPVSTSQTLTSAGQLQFGPFINGTNVMINLQNQQNANCFKNSTSLTQLYCVPTNNLCLGAIPITCGTTINATTNGTTATFYSNSICGTSINTSKGVWYSFMGNGDVVTYSLCGSSFDTRLSVYTGSCVNNNFTCAAYNDNFTSCGSSSQVQLATTTGVLYYIYVYGFGSEQGDFVLSSTCITPPNPPVNDNCDNVTLVSISPFGQCTNVISGTVLGATQSSQSNSCVGTADDDVWFKFVATQTTHTIKIDNVAGSVLDLNHVLYATNNTSNPCQNLIQKTCSNANYSFNTGLVVGQTYYIRIYTATDILLQDTTFDLCVSGLPPTSTNDECITAITLPVNSGLDCVNITNTYILNATASSQTNPCTIGIDDDVWYKFTATNTSHLIQFKNIIGSSINLDFSIYFGDCNSLNSLGCFLTHSNMYHNLTIGQEYFLRIHTADTTIGQYVEFDICISSPSINVSTASLNAIDYVNELIDYNPCITISNATKSAGETAGFNGISTFTNTNPNFSFQSGVVMSTGNATSTQGPNLTINAEGNQAWGGDSELEQIILDGTGQTMVSRNASKLEFDFTSQFPLMTFDFLFASDEYGTFQCNFADAFAFILTDLTTGIKTNLAVVPGTITPISVITIRDNSFNTTCSSVNPQYFDLVNSNLGFEKPINFNGQTVPMTATANIIPNNPYHIKLVVADRSDNAFDSAVFLKSGSFYSGPPQCNNFIEFQTFIDANSNGIKDAGEVIFTNGEFLYDVNNSGTNTNVISPLGKLKLFPNSNTDLHNVTYLINSQYSANLSSLTTYNNVSIANSTTTNFYYFPITINNPYSDVSVNVVGVTPPRPGFTYKNRIIYKNNGVSTTNGTIAFTKDTNVAISSFSNTSAVVTSTGFTLDYTNLLPQETRFVDVIMSVPNIPVVNLGNVLTNSASITSSINDIDLLNNTSNLNQIVVGSYDPNDKMESHGETIDINTFTTDSYLYYTIRFQNTGSANAINIKIEDLLDAQLDPTTLRMISSSHNYTLLREGNQLTWSFVGINLPSILQNEELSQGFVSFKIKPNLGFAVNDMIPNTAEIYFDFNPAIITNTFQTTFVNPLSNQSFLLNAISIYPNPTKEILNINYGTSTIDIKSIEIHDLLGKLVYQTKSKTELINVSSLNSGIYLITISTESNEKMVKKLIKN